MENSISIIADVCGIFGFLISLFAVTKVYQIKKTINSNTNSNRQDARGSGNRQSINTNA
jgi:hypothetical protein